MYFYSATGFLVEKFTEDELPPNSERIIIPSSKSDGICTAWNMNSNLTILQPKDYDIYDRAYFDKQYAYSNLCKNYGLSIDCSPSNWRVKKIITDQTTLRNQLINTENLLNPPNKLDNPSDIQQDIIDFLQDPENFVNISALKRDLQNIPQIKMMLDKKITATQDFLQLIQKNITTLQTSTSNLIKAANEPPDTSSILAMPGDECSVKTVTNAEDCTISYVCDNVQGIIDSYNSLLSISSSNLYTSQMQIIKSLVNSETYSTSFGEGSNASSISMVSNPIIELFTYFNSKITNTIKTIVYCEYMIQYQNLECVRVNLVAQKNKRIQQIYEQMYLLGDAKKPPLLTDTKAVGLPSMDFTSLTAGKSNTDNYMSIKYETSFGNTDDVNELLASTKPFLEALESYIPKIDAIVNYLNDTIIPSLQSCRNAIAKVCQDIQSDTCAKIRSMGM